MKILYVESDESSREQLVSAFNSLGDSVYAVKTGDEALDLLKKQPFDLIVADVLMPVMDGFTLCFMVKRDPELARIPFIFYGATYTLAEDTHFAAQLGADGFLVKPLAFTQLQQDVSAILRRCRETGVATPQIDLAEFSNIHSDWLKHKLMLVRGKLGAAHAALDKSQQHLEQTRRVLGSVVDHGNDAMMVIGPHGELLSWNAEFLRLFKLNPDASTKLTLADLLPAECCQKLSALLENTNPCSADSLNEVLLIKDVRVILTAVGILHQGGRAFLILLRNLSGESGNPANIHQMVLANLSEGVVITDADNIIISVNPAFTRITGYEMEDVVGKRPNLLKSGSQDENFYRQLWTTLMTEGRWQGEIWNRRKNGELYPEWLFLTVIRDEQGEVLFHVGIFSDVSEHEASRKRIYHLTHHDPLTDTPNRALIRYRLVDAIQAAKGNKVALLLLDIDRFKSINDSFGDQMGDKILKMISQRLNETIRQLDTAGRQGADEFVVILAGVPGKEEAGQVARKILLTIAEPYEIDGEEVLLTVSIGIALFPDDGCDEGQIIKNADAALHAAKAEGRNTYRFFDKNLTQADERRVSIEKALPRALGLGELRLVYQPQVRMADATIVGCEVLVRWRHPVLGDVPPSDFIPLAEDSGRISAIGSWILSSACLQAGEWLRSGLPPITFAVNLSAIQFRQPGLIDEVKKVLEEAQLPAQYLELELTEGILMRDARDTLDTLRGLKKMSVQLSIDDFGTGYSNLAYLNRFAVDKLKIDQSFVSGLPGNSNDYAIVQAIVQMAHSLGLEVIAEGVETEMQNCTLAELGCEMAQGYYYAKPLEAAVFERLLRDSMNLCA